MYQYAVGLCLCYTFLAESLSEINKKRIIQHCSQLCHFYNPTVLQCTYRHNDGINAQPNSVSLLLCQRMQLYKCLRPLQVFICIQCTCVAYILSMFKATVPICVRPQRDGRWQIGPTLRKAPQSDAWPRVRCHHNICCGLEPPSPITRPITGADLLPRATATAIEEMTAPK